jgi:GldM C-terminal domain
MKNRKTMVFKYALIILFQMFCVENKVNAQNFSISNKKYSQVFTGLVNPIEFKIKGIKSSSCKLYIKYPKDDTLIYRSAGHFDYLSKSKCPGATTFIIVYKNAKGKLDSLEQQFNLKLLPLPTVYFMGKAKGKVIINLITEVPYFYLNYPGFDYDPNFKTNSFDVEASNYKIKVEGSIFNDEVVKLFKELPAGSEFKFKNINITQRDSGYNFEMDSEVFIIE